MEDSRSLKGQPKNGVQIHGLFLQGCGWDMSKQCLKESDKELSSSSLSYLIITYYKYAIYI